MPVPLRAPHHRADAKFNVTTDFPSLGLHSAASTGNVGLVEYALSRGQPVNSVVDGVLPLHAACAGGNVQVVKLLIEYGADVNAPRLPKRYSSRDSSAPIIGSTGSTPLHFAAANGNREAIMLLLLHGAHADRPDKHGITPEALARQHGWIECADDLKQWVLNKDKDLRERAEFIGSDDRGHGKRRHRIGSFGDQESTHPSRRRLHVKQSIDTALNMLKSSSSNLGESYHRGNHTPTPPTSPTKPFGDYSSTLVTSNSDQFPDSSTRRPSLPHIVQSDSLPRPRKPSSQTTSNNRPRSAGEDAEETPTTTNTRTGRRLASKVSLLSLFRRGQSSDDNAATSNLPVTDASSLSTSPPTISGSSLSQPRQRPHHDSDGSIRSRKPTDPLERKHSVNSHSHSPPLAIELHNALAQEQRNRDRSRSNASSQYDYVVDDGIIPGPGSYHSPGSSPLARRSILRNQGHHRTRSGSGSSLGYDVNVPSRLGIASTTNVEDAPNNARVGSSGADSDNLSRSLPRSGILKPHNRNGSNGQGHMTPSALRAFSAQSRDASSHSPSPRTAPMKLKQSSSVGSLSRTDSYSRRRRSMRPGSAGSMDGPKQGDSDEVPIEEEQEEEEAEYGKPIEDTESSLLIGLTKTPSSRGSLSPIISNDHTVGESEGLIADFPFSINRPPPTDGDMDETASPAIPISGRNGSSTVDNRHRGDSLSSMGTTDSQDYSQTSSTASTMMVATPLMSSEVVPPPEKKQEGLVSGAQVVETEDEDQRSSYVVNVISPGTDSSPSPPPLPPPSSQNHQRRPPPLPLELRSTPAHMRTSSLSSLAPPSTSYVKSGSLSGRRTHTPFDIDISSISTHAQAEALVEKTRQEVEELAGLEDQDLDTSSGSDGRTPLSARLAAYGESLALERRLRELEGGSAGSGVDGSTILVNGERSATSTMNSANLLPVAHQYSADSSKYSGSLYSARSMGGLRDASSTRSVSTGINGTVRAKKSSSRPSTAEGLAPRDMNYSMSSEFSDRSMQSMRSASALGYHANPYHQTIPTLSVSDAEDQPSSPIRNIARSRTPTGDRELNGAIGRMASLDILPQDDDFGLALQRISTAPSPAPRLPPIQAQSRLQSAKKLSKMGISVADQAGISMGSNPMASQGVVHSGKKFGGAIRSFFKGGKP